MPYNSKAKAAAAARRRRKAKKIAGAIGARRGDDGTMRRPAGRQAKYTPETLRAILDAMIKPYSGVLEVAKRFNLSPSTITLWQRLSAQHERDETPDSPFLISYLEQPPTYFHRWMAFVRAVAISQIDARIIESATSSHWEPQYSAQTGTPFWQVDPKVAADAKSMDDFEWELEYSPRQRDDIYARDDEGRLIQVMKEIPPSPAVLVKAAASLLSQTYGERVQHNVTVGGVVRIGGAPNPQARRLAPPPTQQILDADFQPVEEEDTQPTNVLAVAEPPETVEEYERAFGGKRLVEAILFYTEGGPDRGTLLPPLADIVIVEGSSVHHAYLEAGVEVKAVPAAPLVAQGYCNSFLTKLCTPDEVARIKEAEKFAPPEPPEPEPNLRHHPRAYDARTGNRPEPPNPDAGQRYAKIDSGEQVGRGAAPPGGVSVTRFPQRSIRL